MHFNTVLHSDFFLEFFLNILNLKDFLFDLTLYDHTYHTDGIKHKKKKNFAILAFMAPIGLQELAKVFSTVIQKTRHNCERKMQLQWRADDIP